MSSDDGDAGRPVTAREALPAAVSSARAVGLPTGNPVVLHHTNNVIVHLRPAPVLAKVTRSRATAASELAIARHCAALGAPVAEPAIGYGDRVHATASLSTTFWRFYETQPNPAHPAELGGALGRLHDTLASIDVPVPSLGDRLGHVDRILADDAQMVALDRDRRAALRDAVRVLSDTLPRAIFDTEHVVHGEPHADNVLVTATGVRFCDFEGVVRAPAEWDFAFLPPDSLDAAPSLDRELVEQLRIVVSARVATLCWAKLRWLDDDEQRWHAEHHLRRVLEHGAR